MLILALDTSGDICSVAVADAEKGLLLAEYNFAHNRRLTERLPGIVEFVLKDAGATLETIDAFAVGLGPGSFTGVRVGVTMAKVWAEVLGKPLYGVSSLHALAIAVPEVFDCPFGVVPVVPSRKNEVIMEVYLWPSGEEILDPQTCIANSVVDTARFALSGDAPLLIIGECSKWIAESESVTIHMDFPHASDIARLAYHRILLNNFDDPATLSPLYVAPPPIRGKLAGA